jgi:hypothetical protein
VYDRIFRGHSRILVSKFRVVEYPFLFVSLDILIISNDVYSCLMMRRGF